MPFFEDEVHCLAHRQDLRRLLVGHLHAVGVLQLLHERVKVERIGLQILLEPGFPTDVLRIDVQLVGEMGLDQGEDLLAGHRVISPAAG